jgi:hypothetical protein
MPQLTKDSVITRFASYYAMRDQLLADCSKSPDLTRGIILSMEDIQSQAKQVELSADYLTLIDDFLVALAVIGEKATLEEFYKDV